MKKKHQKKINPERRKELMILRQVESDYVKKLNGKVYGMPCPLHKQITLQNGATIIVNPYKRMALKKPYKNKELQKEMFRTMQKEYLESSKNKMKEEIKKTAETEQYKPAEVVPNGMQIGGSAKVSFEPN